MCLMVTIKYWTHGAEIVTWFKETNVDSTGRILIDFYKNLSKTGSSHHPNCCFGLIFYYNNVWLEILNVLLFFLINQEVIGVQEWV